MSLGLLMGGGDSVLHMWPQKPQKSMGHRHSLPSTRIVFEEPQLGQDGTLSGASDT
jgi:hypothetical protein